MKKTIKLAVVAALALGATSAFATNGSTMLSVGAKARGMGGVGIGMSHGAESILSNPAMITNIKSTEVSFGGTLFMPDVESTNGIFAPAPGPGAFSSTNKSAADTFVIPSVSIASKVNENFYTGVGMWGTGGLGVDYRNATAATDTQMEMVTSLQIMQFGVPLAYKMGNFSAAVTPLIQYGTLDINFDTNGSNNVGSGIGSDLEFGYNLGLSYTAGGITLGAIYKSKIDMNYDGALRTAVQAMSPGYQNDTLSTPAEMGVGISYITGNHTIALDYKNIQWSDAMGYKDFGWEDQDVIAIGYEYTTKTWALRTGYSKADSAVQDNTGKTLPDVNVNAALSNVFNSIGFPGNIEEHYTVGGTYSVTDSVSIDLAYVYAPENKTTISSNMWGQPMSVKHSETSYTAQVNIAF